MFPLPILKKILWCPIIERKIRKFGPELADWESETNAQIKYRGSSRCETNQVFMITTKDGGKPKTHLSSRLAPHLFSNTLPTSRLRSRSSLISTPAEPSWVGILCYSNIGVTIYATTSSSNADATTALVIRSTQTTPSPAYATGLTPVAILFHEFYLEDKACTCLRFIQLCSTDARTTGLIVLNLAQSGDSLMKRTAMGLLAGLTKYDLEASNRFLASLAT